jgi:hypothetical protein
MSNQLIAIDTDNIYYGNVTTFGGQSINKIAKWDGLAGTSTSLGNGIGGSITSVIVSDDNKVYVGGYIDNANLGSVIIKNNVAYYNGTSWSSIGDTLLFDGGIDCMLYDTNNDLLYIGTSNTTNTSYRISMWNGTIWTGISTTFTVLEGSNISMTLDNDGNLYISYTGTTIFLKRSYQSQTWSTLPSFNNTIYTLQYNKIHNIILIGTSNTTSSVFYYNITTNTYVTLPNTNTNNVTRCTGIVFSTTNQLFIVCISNSYNKYILKYNASNLTVTDGTWEPIFNFPNAGSINTIIFDNNNNLIVKGTLKNVIGISPYDTEDWQEIINTTSFDFGGLPIISETPPYNPVIFKSYWNFTINDDPYLQNHLNHILYFTKISDNTDKYNILSNYLKLHKINKVYTKIANSTSTEYILDIKK